MKSIILVTVFISCTACIFSQSLGGNAFQAQSIYTGYAVSGNDVVLPVYKGGGEIGGNPYFNKDWTKGSVKTTDNNEFSKKLLFMYDKVAGKLYFKNTDSNVIMEADADKIYSFTLITDKPHVFMRGEFFSPDYKGKFLEVLLYDMNKYSFLKYTATSFEEPVTSKASQAMTQAISYGKYVDNTTWFIYYNNLLQPVELKKKSFPKAFEGDVQAKVEAYIKNNSGNFNESYIINMLGDINEDLQ